MDTESLLSAAETGATLVAANTRTQRRLQGLYDARQQQRCGAWPTPAILTWSAWIETLWQEYLLTAAAPPVRLNPMQEQVLWERVIRNSEAGQQLMAIDSTAELARKAWQLLHEYCATNRSLLDATIDGSVFKGWAESFEQLCRTNSWIDGARVPDSFSGAIAEGVLHLNGQVVFVGFDRLTPQQERLAATLQDSGCACESSDIGDFADAANLGVVALNDRHAEIQRAAEWARRRLENSPAASIGIVVPDLESVRAHLERVFTEVLAPESLLGTGDAHRAFELSLGRPLAAYPMIHAALQLLHWLNAPLAIGNAGALLRSVYLRDGEGEASARAVLAVTMYRECGPEVSLAEASRLARQNRNPGCPVLANLLTALLRQFDSHPKIPSMWSRHWSELLRGAGWPGDRTSSSSDHQTHEAWLKLLRSFGSLDAAEPVLSGADALHRLNQAAQQEVFQPENIGAPVQVMGALEASGSRFDHLWVMGLDDESWPARARGNPLLPPVLQIRYKMPHCSSAADLEFAQRVTRRLCHSAGEVVFSYPCVDGERSLRPSPLLSEFPKHAMEDLFPDAAGGGAWIRMIEASATPETLAEESPLKISDEETRGGTKVFQLQAACPFRAFAELRLGAEATEEPVPGLSPVERGQLVHLVLQLVWERLDGSSDLVALDQAAQHDLISSCVDQALRRNHEHSVWSTRFAVLERERLISIVSAWLDCEKDRAPFRVIEREKKKEIEVGGMRVKVRVDRIDELTSGGKVIIDYKTGTPKSPESAWDGERPDEPQLPLYAVADGEGLVALTFASVRPGEYKFRGQADALGVLPGVKPLLDQTLHDKVEQWRTVLTALGEQFRAGHVEVDPKNADACRFCPLDSLCRCHEEVVAPGSCPAGPVGSSEAAREIARIGIPKDLSKAHQAISSDDVSEDADAD